MDLVLTYCGLNYEQCNQVCHTDILYFTVEIILCQECKELQNDYTFEHSEILSCGR